MVRCLESYNRAVVVWRRATLSYCYSNTLPDKFQVLACSVFVFGLRTNVIPFPNNSQDQTVDLIDSKVMPKLWPRGKLIHAKQGPKKILYSMSILFHDQNP